MDNKMEHETKLGRYRDAYVYIYIYLELYMHRGSWFSNDSRSTTALELKTCLRSSRELPAALNRLGTLHLPPFKTLL